MLALAAVFVISGCRQDMQNQPKFVPLRSSEFFPDHRSARYPVEGTVPRLDVPKLKDAALEPERNAQLLDPGSYYFTGKHGNAFGNELPPWLPLNAQLMARGQERYNIYCAPCHARVGDGNGMIVQRGFKHPPSYHQPRLRNAPIGYFYDIISNGIGAMPDYSTQIKPADRWAVAAYVRALQLSQSAKESDVSAADSGKLNTPSAEEHGITIPSTSTTSPTGMQSQRGVKP